MTSFYGFAWNSKCPPTTKLGSFRISRWQMFFKIDSLKNFVIFTGKRLCLRFQQGCFPVNIRDGSRAAATSTTERFVIIVNGFLPLTIITKRPILDGAPALDPPLNIATFLRTGFFTELIRWLLLRMVNKQELMLVSRWKSWITSRSGEKYLWLCPDFYKPTHN